MMPEVSGDVINYKRQANVALGNVTISISWHTVN
jgi:hypothetical protein